jgi:hypothetical protein
VYLVAYNCNFFHVDPSLSRGGVKPPPLVVYYDVVLS